MYSDINIENILSLARFYQSIPDYCEINHLPERQFQTTLDRLKETSSKLNTTIRCKVNNINDSIIQVSSSSTKSRKCNKFKCNELKALSLSESLSEKPQDDNNSKNNKIENDLLESEKRIENIRFTFTNSNRNETPSLSSSKKTKPVKKDISKRKCKPSPCPLSSLLGFNSKFSKIHIETPSPIFPAARLNLASTLRAQVSRKKRLELDNRNITPSNISNKKDDWEVRKTPGWKSLTYCTSHSDKLLYKLATRRAEQKLQKQEYDINMELMRQRVKSAPLLLERGSYFNPRRCSRSSQNCSQFSGFRESKIIKVKNSTDYPTKNEFKIKQCQQINDSDDLTSEDRAFL